nr:hypothetical protein [Tanacetum cinerariifolium]
MLRFVCYGNVGASVTGLAPALGQGKEVSLQDKLTFEPPFPSSTVCRTAVSNANLRLFYTIINYHLRKGMVAMVDSRIDYNGA